MEGQSVSKRINFIDSLKGICILFVTVTHYSFSDSERIKWLFPFWIDMAVPIFMMISGYVYSASFEKNKISVISEAYKVEFILKKIIRFTVPFLITLIIELIANIVIKSVEFKFRLGSLLVLFLNGGWGAGSYYYPIMIQFLFSFPVIFIITKHKPKAGLLFCFIFNAMFELLQMSYGMNGGCYRLLLFRYTFAIGFGCFLYFYKENIRIYCFVISMICGMFFIVLFRYLSYKPKVVVHWTGTSFIAIMYVIPVFYYMMKKAEKIKIPFMNLCGKASFNIFLTQMVYYKFACRFVYKHISYRLFQLCINVFVCFLFGILFYFFEKPITKYVINNSKKLSFRIELGIKKIVD